MPENFNNIVLEDANFLFTMLISDDAVVVAEVLGGLRARLNEI